MARRRKLNIRHRASDNEGIQSTSNNTNSTNVEGSNVAETRSSPCHAEGVIHESVESHSIPSDIEVEEEQIEKGINYIFFVLKFYLYCFYYDLYAHKMLLSFCFVCRSRA